LSGDAPRAVNIITGTLSPRCLIRLKTPTPSIPGSMMSSTTTAGSNSVTASSPEMPS